MALRAIAGAAMVVATSLLAPPAHADGREVALHIAGPEDRVDPPILDRLGSGDVLRFTVDGGPSGGHGVVHQCDINGDRCTNNFPVLFDDQGVARFQYQLIDVHGCGADDSCVVAVEAEDGGGSTFAFVIFGEAAPAAPNVLIAPNGPYEPHAWVTVTLGGLAGGSTATIGFCTSRCDSVTVVTAAPDGRASAELTIGGRCRPCGIRVVAGPRTTMVPVAFLPLPSPMNAPRRIAMGLAVAVVLLLAAWRITASTDWRPPSEAGTPELDHAVLDEVDVLA